PLRPTRRRGRRWTRSCGAGYELVLGEEDERMEEAHVLAQRVEAARRPAFDAAADRGVAAAAERVREPGHRSEEPALAGDTKAQVFGHDVQCLVDVRHHERTCIGWKPRSPQRLHEPPLQTPP